MKLMDGTKESTPKMGEDPMLHDLLWRVPDPDAGVTEEGRRILLSRVQESRAMRAGAKTRSLKPAGIVAGLVAFGTLTFGAAASGGGVQALLESVGLPSRVPRPRWPDQPRPGTRLSDTGAGGRGQSCPGSNEAAPPVTAGANERERARPPPTDAGTAGLQRRSRQGLRRTSGRGASLQRHGGWRRELVSASPSPLPQARRQRPGRGLRP